jgi:hypothetical protein
LSRSGTIVKYSAPEGFFQKQLAEFMKDEGTLISEENQVMFQGTEGEFTQQTVMYK